MARRGRRGGGGEAVGGERRLKNYYFDEMSMGMNDDPKTWLEVGFVLLCTAWSSVIGHCVIVRMLIHTYGFVLLYYLCLL